MLDFWDKLFVWWLTTEPERRREHREQVRIEDLRHVWWERVAPAITNATEAWLAQPEQPSSSLRSDIESITTHLDFRTMGYRYQHRFDFYKTIEDYELCRDPKGRWYQKRWCAAPSPAQSPEEVERARAHAEENPNDPAAQARYSIELSRVTNWQRLRQADFCEFLEQSYQRCIRFFAAHPGLSPDTTEKEWLQGPSGPTWQPIMPDWREVRSSWKQSKKLQEQCERVIFLQCCEWLASKARDVVVDEEGESVAEKATLERYQELVRQIAKEVDVHQKALLQQRRFDPWVKWRDVEEVDVLASRSGHAFVELYAHGISVLLDARSANTQVLKCQLAKIPGFDALAAIELIGGTKNRRFLWVPGRGIVSRDLVHRPLLFRKLRR